jgi:hypothetical protein
MTQREHEADSDRTFSILHQLARDIVDGRYVIGIDGVAQAEAICEECRSEEHWVMVEGDAGPDPCTDIEREQDAVHGSNAATEVIGGIVEQIRQFRTHGEPSA